MELVVTGWCLVILGALLLFLTVVAPALIALRKESHEGRRHEWVRWGFRALVRLIIVASLIAGGYAILSGKYKPTAKGGETNWEPTHQKTISDIFK
jgi:hypothetical protein